jgi:uracil-DNA glycosylase
MHLKKPKTILVLGKFTAQFLSNTSQRLNCWAVIKNFKTIDQRQFQIQKNVIFNNGIKSNLVLLTHPSYRPVNVFRRAYNGEYGHNAELNMIKAVL